MKCLSVPTVSESMAAFLTAEHLAQHSVSESQIQNAMDQAQRNQQVVVANKPTQKSKPPLKTPTLQVWGSTR